ncbi:MAG: hypothetical protein ABSH34_08480 [Verrucomicrobiota bacterium]
MNLRDDELLLLEGAEDFDVVSGAAGAGVQVKATAGNITLRSKPVVSALNSFWLLKCKNKERQVSFRLITTSRAGTEQGAPFGPRRKGLDLWMECAERRDLGLAEELRRFLTTDSVLAEQLEPCGTEACPAPAPTLLQFLRAVDATGVLDNLITRIYWSTESGDSEVVRETVAMYLRAHGERQRLRPSDCAPALDKLFRIAAETAAKKHGRALSRDDFRIAFEEATTKRYSHSEIVEITTKAEWMNRLVGLAAKEGGKVTFGTTGLVSAGIPDLPPGCVRRAACVGQVWDLGRKFRGAIITGSSGMGKSTLAKLVAQGRAGAWMWADFQGVDPDHVPEMLRLSANRFIESDETIHLAVDNLDFEVSDMPRVETILGALLRSVRRRDGDFVLTTRREVPGRLLHKLQVNPDAVYRIPSFTEDEIAEFSEGLGCPAGGLASAVAKIVRLQTAGHPQLVHARLLGLSRNGWPWPRTHDLLGQPPEIAQELDVARQLLMDIPEGDRELLYRLSILTGRFRRDQVLSIAQIEPPVQFGGDVFTRLLGPWIELARNGYYRISPLLNRAAERTWTPAKVGALRGELARAILSCGKMSLTEAHEVLFQGLLAEDQASVTLVAIALGRASPAANRQIADALFWLTAFGRDRSKRVFPKNASTNYLLRLVQFRVLAESDPEDLGWFCAAIDAETPGGLGPSGVRWRLMWLTQALVFTDARIAPQTLVAYWAEAVELVPNDKAYRKAGASLARCISPLSGRIGLDALGGLFATTLLRRGDLNYLLGLMKAVGRLCGPTRDRAAGYIKRLPLVVRVALDRAWLKESEEVRPDWTRVLTLLAELRQVAVELGLLDMGALAWRATATIHDEFLSAPGEALEALAAGMRLASSHTYLLEHQKGSVLSRQGRCAEALAIWQRILPAWPVQPGVPDTLPLFACEQAGECAGRLKDWPLAATFFARGQCLATILGLELQRITFLADESFVRWKNGEKAAALAHLAKVVRQLESLKADKEVSPQVHRAWKTIEQVIKWCALDGGLVSAVDTFEPTAGFCSRWEADARLNEIPRAPIDILWWFLAETEFRSGLGRAIYTEAMSRVSRSKYAAFRATMARLSLSWVFRDRSFVTLVARVLSFNRYLCEARAQAEAGRVAPIPDGPAEPARASPAPLLEDAIFAALLILAASNAPLDTFAPQWMQAISGLAMGSDVTAVADQCRKALTADRHEVYRLYQDPTEGRLARMIAALRLALDAENRLEIMFVSQVSLVDATASGAFKDDVSGAVGEIVKRSWERRFRFIADFSMPRVSVPPIMAACAGEGAGFALAARILHEARFAVQAVRLEPNDLSLLKTLAGLQR